MRLFPVLLSLLFTVPLARAADSLNPELQRGLFEEEANQDFAAAIRAYQSVLSAHDDERKLAATALFRLGECYRKLGKTNDAIAQYKRLIAEFEDQAALANLSRQNLVGLGSPRVSESRPGGSSNTSERIRLLEQALTEQQLSEAIRSRALLKQLTAMSRPELRRVLPTAAPDTLLNSLLEQLSFNERRLTELSARYTAEHPTVKEARTVIAKLNEQIDERIDGVVNGLKVKSEALTQQTEDLKRELASLKAAGGATGAIDDAGSADPAARAQLKELLQSEIKIAEQFATEQRKKVEVGTLAPGDQVRFERDVLNLKRQLIAADGLASAEDRTQWRELLLQEIKLAEDATRFEKQKLDSGKAIASEVARLQRDVLILKRELVSFDAAPASSGGGVSRTSFAQRLQAVVNASASGAATDEEEKEIRRIHAHIKDSPDLVNAKNIPIGVYGESQRHGAPLHKAAQQGQLVVARFLIENHADVDARDGMGRTPLHWAAANGHKSMVELLLSKGAEVNAAVATGSGTGSGGYTPLHFASQAGYRSVCETLLAAKANVNARAYNDDTPLHFAVGRSYRTIAQLLIEKGAAVNAKNGGGDTPLHQAVANGSQQLMELLLANKAEINAQATDGSTPLHRAVSGKLEEAVRLLLANKADLELKYTGTKWGNWTPLLFAVKDKSIAVARLLLEAGANPNAPWRGQGWTALFQTISDDNTELAARLLAHRADVNARESSENMTPLVFAAMKNSSGAAAVIDAMIKNQADVNAVDRNGYTALHYAAAARNKAVGQLLLEAGADVNAMNRSGDTPLSLLKIGAQARSSLPGLPAPARPIPGSPSPPGPAVEKSDSELSDLIRQRGGRDDLRRLSALGSSRPGFEQRADWFQKGTNAWNRYSLFELIAVEYQSQSSFHVFPDFSRITINRINLKATGTEDLRVDLETILKNGDCAQDRWLEWGDIVTLPERDHLLYETWMGIGQTERTALQKCLERTVTLTVKGQSTNVVLKPWSTEGRWNPRMAYFRLRKFIYGSSLLLASSDTTRVKVKRIDAGTKQDREMIFDLEKTEDPFDLWLRDGDVIEVPDKPVADPRAKASPEADSGALPRVIAPRSVPARNLRELPPPAPTR